MYVFYMSGIHGSSLPVYLDFLSLGKRVSSYVKVSLKSSTQTIFGHAKRCVWNAKLGQ